MENYSVKMFIKYFVKKCINSFDYFIRVNYASLLILLFFFIITTSIIITVFQLQLCTYYKKKNIYFK